MDETSSVISSQDSVPVEDNLSSVSCDYNEDDCGPQSENSGDEMPSLKDLAVRYLIKIKEGNKLSNKAAQNIVATTSQLFDIAFEKLEKRIQESLTQAGLQIEDVPGIEEVFDEKYVSTYFCQ